jgi:hypothetical protein
LDFCYLTQQSDFDTGTLKALDDALHCFHTYCEVFHTSRVCESGFLLPHQHSLVYYHKNIKDFRAPNGLCSSITELWHITAVKKPWWCSNHYEALGQMMITNQWLDKLMAAWSNFVACGMLPPEHGPPPGFHDDKDDDGGPINEDGVMADVRLARTPGISIKTKPIPPN